MMVFCVNLVAILKTVTILMRQDLNAINSLFYRCSLHFHLCPLPAANIDGFFNINEIDPALHSSLSASSLDNYSKRTVDEG
jgi:hypothetical protein